MTDPTPEQMRNLAKNLVSLNNETLGITDQERIDGAIICCIWGAEDMGGRRDMSFGVKFGMLWNFMHLEANLIGVVKLPKLAPQERVIHWLDRIEFHNQRLSCQVC